MAAGEAVAVVAVVAECRKSVVAVVVAGGVVVAEVVVVVAVVVVEDAAGALASAIEVAGKGEGMDESGNAVGEAAGWGVTEEVGRLEVGARDGAGGEAGESVSEEFPYVRRCAVGRRRQQAERQSMQAE